MTWTTISGTTTCWRPEQADAVIPVEAEAVEEEIFQATHVPLRLRHVSAEQPTSAVVESDVTEEDVLKYVLDRLSPGRRATDVIPILGDSGAGKSHLVRWLRNELHHHEIDDVRVIFVPKHRTSLRGVVELVLREFPDEPELDAFRQRLLSAHDADISEAEHRGRMRDALCNGLEHHADRTAAEDVSEEQARSYLAANLPKLLRDPHFAPRYLADGHAIARLVEEKLTGRRGDEAVADAFQFSAEDVSVSVDDVSAASAPAREAANTLAADPPLPTGESVRQLAARMLNDQLPASIREVFGIGGEDLRELFVEIRRTLRGRQDLALLVEDFAMFQGLQSGLLDAITLHSTQTEPLCHLVTVFAVTTGYYVSHMPDTLHSRAGAAFEVGPQSSDAPTQFASSYLRAIRLGVDALRERHQRYEPGASSCEGCPVIEACHADFGSWNGEGLYPFSSTFLQRASEAVLDRGFNARRFLREVLRPVLVQEHAAIEVGEYPTERVAERFDARRHEPPGDALAALRREPEGERRARLALLYRPIVNDGDLAPSLHDAFDIPALGRVASHGEPAKGTEAGEKKATDKKSPPRSKVPELVGAIDTWRAEGTLLQDHRKQVRQLVTRAVLARIDFTDGGYRRSVWTDTTLRPRFDTSDQANSVVIDGNRGQTKGLAEIEISSRDAKAVDAVQSLAWISVRPSWRQVENGFARSARLEVVLRRWADDVEKQLGLRSEVDETLVAAMQALEVIAGLNGAGAVPRQRSERLARLLVETPVSSGSPEVSTLGELLAKERSLLREYVQRRLGYAQGDTGSLAAFDHRLTRIAFDRSTQEPELWAKVGQDIEGPVGDALGRVEAAAKRLRQVAEMAATQIPDLEVLGGDLPADIADRLVKVVKRTQVPRSFLTELRTLASSITADDLELLRRDEAELSSWKSLSTNDLAALMGGQWSIVVQFVGEFIRRSEELLAMATPTGAVLGRDERGAAEEAWTAALLNAQHAVTRLQKATR